MKNLFFLTMLIIFGSSLETNSKNSVEEGNKLKKISSVKKRKISYIQKSTDKANKTYNSDKTSTKNLKNKDYGDNYYDKDSSKTYFNKQKIKEVDYFNVKVKNCNSDSCRTEFGVCTTKTNCQCIKGQANLNDRERLTCDYVQKRQTTAFMLEFFLPCGIGLFYIGLWGIGLLKMTIVLLLPIGLYIMMRCIKKRSYTYILGICTAIVITIWWLIDIVLLGLNKYRDNYGVPLLEW